MSNFAVETRQSLNGTGHKKLKILFEGNLSFIRQCFLEMFKLDIKCVNVKMIEQERSFKTSREKAPVTTNWTLLLDACALELPETSNKILTVKLKRNATNVQIYRQDVNLL